MYLPLETTFAIFVGGLMRLIANKLAARRAADAGQVESTGTLVASGFIAGEALMGMLLATLAFREIPSLTALVFGRESFAFFEPWGGWLSLVIFAVVAWGLIKVPVTAARRGG
jgi:hypothetical protein